MINLRGTDCHGSGAYLAPRGDDVHHGVDPKAVKGEAVIALEGGTCTKIGLPYYSNEHPEKNYFRYIQVTVKNGDRHRYFYCSSFPLVGDTVEKGDIIGWAQGIEDVYPGITPHIHFEIKKPDGSFIDPVPYLEALGYEF